MLFNSLDFAVFLPIVFGLYWFVTHRNLRLQNCLVLLASYYFYGCWDWRFLGLIMVSTVMDFVVGRALRNTTKPNHRKGLLSLSLLFNIGLLATFKYCNFFVESFAEALSLFGTKPNITTLEIILPVGISFYTFQTLSYTIDVYRRKIEPTRDFIQFAAYVSFFPQLVAGPIERASNLLPQFASQRVFSEPQARDGMRQILWGLFKKMVIADNCAVYANMIFENPGTYSGSELFLGAVFFAFQIYGDFSGYSDIAIGTSRLFGFNLMQNFAFPYFSRDIAEFWRRWHISLSTWFRDYVYIPLGGSRGGKWKTIRNVFIIFLVSGFWHGPNWTFIMWGLIHAILFLPLLLFHKNRSNMDIVAHDRHLPSLMDLIRILMTFGVLTLAWVFFRAETIGEAYEYLTGIFDPSLLTIPSFDEGSNMVYLWLIFAVLLLTEWLGRRGKHALELIDAIRYRIVRWSYYSFILFLIMMYMRSEDIPFIYFQF